ncbi:regulator of sigma E protease [Flexibacter flexilis DSM 6793]|uniref:Zinc metalloprotease n=1 Tax=Flexibacter flexilis DSM 6793 TaxID=927664 RepID=A0A1I1ISS6_9BACT|nr:RIP metalloprotease RseP [Flexibacter flexilis]SFC39329.1 regulator of sigma E protease [Flexibacter flexilis DSM 6793]
MLEGLIMAGQLLLGLTILVGLHELGHLLAAKLFGMRVEKYSIGFPPKIWGFQWGETEYSFGAIPLGGFVKISGMIDESLDLESMQKDPEPWEFRAKPAWQRLIVMLGGIIVNVITGVVIFIAWLAYYGESYLPVSQAKYGIIAHPAAQKMGFQDGDKILKINGQAVHSFDEVAKPDLFMNDGTRYTIDRNGQIMDLAVPKGFMDVISSAKGAFVEPRMPFVVDMVAPNTGAEKAGVKTGDKILTINNKETAYFQELKRVLETEKGKTVDLGILRGTETLHLKAEISGDGTLGFQPKFLLKDSTRHYGFGTCVSKGSGMAFGLVAMQVKAFGKMFSGEISPTKSLSGPIGIAKQFGGVWIWQKFWYLVGFLSMVLAFMNLLPIPALDGGHVVFLTYEIISGRKPSDKVLENAQKVGMILLLSLMAFAFLNDLL